MYQEMNVEKLGKMCAAKETNSNTLKRIYKEIHDTDMEMKSYLESLIASNENAPMDILEEMRNSDDLLVRAAAIDNPKAPKNWKTQGGKDLGPKMQLSGFAEIFGD